MSPKFLFIFAIFAGWLISVGAGHRPPSKDAAFSQIQSIVKTLSEITGMEEKRPVPYARMSKHELRQFLAKRMKKTLRPEEIRADETALKMFGLVPQNFDLKKSTIDLLTEQAAAFYDYDEKKLFMLENSSIDAEVTTLAHELAHALADQHFDLEKFMDDTSENDDENLARNAVVEGEASWLMIAYNLKIAGRPIEPTPEMLKSFVDSSKDSSDEYPVLKQSPLYVRESLLFPYSDGTAFFDAVYKKEGKEAFEGVFENPPVDSSQIIHPDRYFAHVKELKPDLPKAPGLSAQYQISDGSVGEFDHRVLLQQYLGVKEAYALSPHLLGGQFKIVGTGKAHHPVLLYASEWDSPANASEFFLDYQKVLGSKWKHCDVSTAREGVYAGQGDSGFFVSKLKGTTVTSIEGLPDGDQQRELTSSGRSGAFGHQVVFAIRSGPSAPARRGS
jgi:hypothetical protein